MPIYPLPVFSEEQELAAIEKLRPPKTVVVRYGYLKSVAELPYDGDQILGCGTKLIVRTPRGIELAEMLTTTCSNSGCGKSVSRKQMLDYIEASGGKQYPFSTEGKVLRVATVEDLNEHSKIETEKPRLVKVAKEAIKALDLPMKLVEVEELFSRDKVVFYFLSEDRIDFRELVRRLAADLHVRIEMRQVGARDEARLVADYEKCGQHCCCKQFLKVLKPVSMRSAKVQKATLDPSKISGRCGRLMCCLRYEDETYEDLRKRLPNRKSRVKTPDGIGTVISSQILTQLVLVELDGSYKRFAFPLENIEVLTGDAAKPPPPRPEREERPMRDRGERRPLRDVAAAGGAAEPVEGGEGAAQEQRPPRDNRDRGPRDGRDQRDRGPRRDQNQPQQRRDDRTSGGPQRPRPGQPLRDNEVESREGEQAADLPTEELNDQLESPEMGRDIEGPDDGPDTGEATDQAQGQPPALGPDGQPLRRKRRRRRRRRGRGPGSPGSPGSGPGQGGEPGEGQRGSADSDQGGGPPPPPSAPPER